MQQLANGLTGEKIERFLRKWQHRLPCPFRRGNGAGYRYQVSMSQWNLPSRKSWTQPRHGRIFFEEVIRENVDLGRPENIQLIFARRVTKRTPGPFRTRVVREGVIPSLYVDYKSNRLKQYFKEGRALRTELTVHNPRDFGLDRGLENLSALREWPFKPTDVCCTSKRPAKISLFPKQLFQEVTRPQVRGRATSLGVAFWRSHRVGVVRRVGVVPAVAPGFSQCRFAGDIAPLLGDDPSQWTPGRLTYQLRRLRLHGLIERVPNSTRYTVTDRGIKVALWFSRCQRVCSGLPSENYWPKNTPRTVCCPAR